MIDDPLEPEVRELIAAGRDRLGPDATTIARLRSRIDTAIAASPRTAVRQIALKLIVVVALTGIGVGAYVGRNAAPDGGAPTVMMTAEEAASAGEVSVVTRDSAASSAASTSDAAPSALPPSALPPSSRARAPLESKRTPPSPEPRGDDFAVAAAEQGTKASLAREIELIDRATLAMRRADAPSALEALRVYDVETAGHGQLAQDAAALGVEVRCSQHDPRAADALARFEQQWPQSAQRRRLDVVCQTANNRR